ncbi:transport-associated protein [Alkaliphilus metalliredigens QYMF]|uniref:Transport-associated protein n=1 Tax=Alkaliphilus metalliredigens (strain QYMF) TaxID=293826 RepID=A6TW20_ALKMQ|nr:BON domain-containing protein [Alkaliphilus metalliredigens]ABR50388.1 transport-associated protein [Alkaliphilus metalliredigens QYMF]
MSNPKSKKTKNASQDNGKPTRDQLIVDYAKDQIEEKMQASAMDINCFCRDGFVHVSGMVDVLAEKQRAEEIIGKIEGVRKIENKITVAMDSNITDKHMEKEVLLRFQEYPHDDAVRGLGVKVHDGGASLLGHVDNLKSAHDAMDLASQVRGIKHVVNNITIDTLGDYPDTTISNHIIQQYSQIPIGYKDIHRKVSGGVVTLTGYVDNLQEVELAGEIAKGTEGVKKVRNRLRARDK